MQFSYFNKSLKNAYIKRSKQQAQYCSKIRLECQMNLDEQFKIETVTGKDDNYSSLLKSDLKFLLTKKQFQVVYLHFIQGISVAQIAHILNISRQAVNKLKMSALLHLKMEHF